MIKSSESDNHIATEQGTVDADGDMKNEPGAPAKKPRRKRTIFPTEQVNKLELTFLENPYPSFYQRESLGSELGIEETAINNWFKNKRARDIRARDKAKMKEPKESLSNLKDHLVLENEKDPKESVKNSVKNLEDPLVLENEKEPKKSERKLKDPNEEKKTEDPDDINRNPQPSSHSKDVSVYEFPGFANGRTEVTEAFEPILLKILSDPPQ